MTSATSTSRIVAMWGILMALTALSWWSGTGHGFGHDGTHVATAIVLGVAFLKVRVVAMNFMELRHAALPLRLVMDAWITIVPLALMGLYLSA